MRSTGLISGLLGDALIRHRSGAFADSGNLQKYNLSSSENLLRKTVLQRKVPQDHFTFQFSSNSGNSHDREKTAEEKRRRLILSDDFVKALHNISGDIYGKISDKPAAVKDRGAETADFLKTADAVPALPRDRDGRKKITRPLFQAAGNNAGIRRSWKFRRAAMRQCKEIPVNPMNFQDFIG